MPLTKAKIYILANGTQPESSFDVLFNPNEYTVTQQNDFSEFTNSQVIIHKFSGQKPKTLDMTLYFDTYEKKVSVKDQVDKILSLLYSYGKEPTVCKFLWGDFSFTGILKSASQEYSMFLSSGEPVRATVKVQFIYYNTAKASDKQNTETAIVLTEQQKKSIQGITYLVSGDPEEWKSTAKANGVDNPRRA